MQQSHVFLAPVVSDNHPPDCLLAKEKQFVPSLGPLVACSSLVRDKFRLTWSKQIKYFIILSTAFKRELSSKSNDAFSWLYFKFWDLTTVFSNNLSDYYITKQILPS